MGSDLGIFFNTQIKDTAPDCIISYISLKAKKGKYRQIS